MRENRYLELSILSDLYLAFLNWWLNYKSIPIVAALLGALGVRTIFGLDILKKENAVLYVIIIGCILIAMLSIYTFACYMHNRIPQAHDGTLAVLFSIDTEDDSLYRSVCYKLVSNFKDQINSMDTKPFEVICVPKKRIERKYPSSNLHQMIELLRKTNCVIFVAVKYDVDDVTHAEHYAMKINCGILHPHFSQEAEQVLSHDLNALSASVNQRKFKKAQLLDEFNFTAQALSYICRYMIGLVYLLAQYPGEAYEALASLYGQLRHTGHECLLPNFDQLVRQRLFSSLISMMYCNMLNFEKDHDTSYLQLSRDQLCLANKIYPETYVYNLNMAYICVILDRDVQQAKICIGKCKMQKEDNAWRYSDAFLGAYCGEIPPMVICAKYEQALSSCPYNLIRLIDYVEYILEMEPDKTNLHLAVGLLYEAINDPYQMKKHLSEYITCQPLLDDRTKKRLKTKMKQLPCNVNCNKDCITCVLPEE